MGSKEGVWVGWVKGVGERVGGARRGVGEGTG